MESSQKKSKKNNSAIVNENEFRVVGMSRSGNHAILNWIIKQLQGRYCFLNCAEPKTNPFYTARPIEDEKVYEANYEGFDLEKEKSGSFSKKDYLIHSYEDCFLGSLNHKLFEKQHDAYVGPSNKRFDILILRDPFNLFASRKKFDILNKLKEMGCQPVTPRTSRRIWKQHAREAIGEKKFLKKERIIINYNLWVNDRKYRQRIAEALELNFTDNGFSNVSKVAGGSSFDGLGFSNTAENMKVLERWKHYKNDESFQEIFDEELVNLSNEIFDEVPQKPLLRAN